MAALKKIETVPGFTLLSKNFRVQFIAGLQNKQVSKSVEEETDWKRVIFIILQNFEKFPLSEEKIHHFITKDLNSCIRTIGRTQQPALNISVKIEERVYYPKPKCLTISFTDTLKTTEIIFHIVKRNLL